MTGLSNQTEDLGGKLLELLLLMVPAISRVDVLINSNNPVTERQFANMQEVSAALRVVTRTIATPEVATLGDALEALWTLCPGLRHRVATEQGEIREHVNVFVGQENIRYTGGLATGVPDGAEISIFHAVSGGSAS